MSMESELDCLDSKPSPTTYCVALGKEYASLSFRFLSYERHNNSSYFKGWM